MEEFIKLLEKQIEVLRTKIEVTELELKIACSEGIYSTDIVEVEGFIAGIRYAEKELENIVKQLKN